MVRLIQIIVLISTLVNVLSEWVLASGAQNAALGGLLTSVSNVSRLVIVELILVCLILSPCPSFTFV